MVPDFYNRQTSTNDFSTLNEYFQKIFKPASLGESNSKSTPPKILITFFDSGEVFPLSKFDIQLAKISAQEHFCGLKFGLKDSFLMFFKFAKKFF